MAEPIDRLRTALAGRYRVERELGAGGMATVYLAHDERHGREVAVKVLREDLGASLGAERFHREIRIAAALQHPHILPLYDSGDADGLLFYVMPFVDGVTLRDRLLKEGELPIADAVRILRDIADALAAAHKRGVVHRDLKPENVMVSGRHALVTDFGVAKALSESTGRQSLTTIGVALGTPTYMAPEQATADVHLDHRADIYAFGVLAYELLAGHPPFTGNSPQEVLAAHVTRPAEPVTTGRAAIPPALSSLVMRCLEKRPADRWQSAEEMIPQLEAAMTPSGGITPAGTQPIDALRVVERRRVIPIGLAVAGVVGLIAAIAILARGSDGGAVPADGERSIAVIPFESVSGDSSDRSFILGVHGEIVTQLSKIPAMHVATRSSSSAYANSAKSAKMVADELGVTTLLTGTVQRAGGRVRFQVALEDASQGRQIWGDSYERELTAENLFAMQGEVARQVANALQVRLSESESAELSRSPTANLAALDAFHRAEVLLTERGRPESDSLLVVTAEAAVELDPTFARAWSLLSIARSWRIRADAVSDTLGALRALERVRQLAPGSLEALLAEGYYLYYAQARFGEALSALERANRVLPNSADILVAMALLKRRLGRFNDALATVVRATSLDRRHVNAWSTAGETYVYLMRPEDGLDAYNQAAAINPESPVWKQAKWAVLLTAKGDTAAARRAREASPGLPEPFRSGQAYYVALYQRDYAAALRAVRNTGALDGFGPSDLNVVTSTAVLHRLAGAPARARGSADSVRAIYERMFAASGRWDPFRRRALAEIQTAVALAAAGDSARAVRMTQHALTVLTPEVDAMEAAYMPLYAAMAYAYAGRTRDAVAQLKIAIAIPCVVWPFELRNDPRWDPLRGDPEFETLARGR